ncbi:hypothetical protein PspMM1_11030 [Pseudoalteromonas sp. MM1]|nr:hypothetical protein PspMM1_11030 [Pseudoalteromonas sp. MM1]
MTPQTKVLAVCENAKRELTGFGNPAYMGRILAFFKQKKTPHNRGALLNNPTTVGLFLRLHNL